MDIQLMREFIALVNLKSYRKVAQQFHIAPSTLSRHIKAIGKELGHPLFENLRAYQLSRARWSGRAMRLHATCA